MGGADGGLNTAAYSDAVGEWGRYLAAVRGRAATTVDRYRLVVRRLEAACGDLAGLGYGDLEGHLRDLYVAGAAASTIAGAVSAIRGFYDWMAARGAVAASPAARLMGPGRRYEEEAPYLTVPEVRRLVLGERPGTLPADPLAARDRVLLALAYVLGLRVSEPGGLRVEDVGWDEGELLYSVLVRRAKWSSRDERLVVAQPVVSRMLGAYLEVRRRRWPECPWLLPNAAGGRLGRRSASRIFDAAVAAAKIERRGRRITFHILRHSIATHLYQRGMREKAIGLWLRHRDPRSTQRYVHVRDRGLVRMRRRLDPLSAPRAAVPDVHGVGRALVGDVAAALRTAEPTN